MHSNAKLIEMDCRSVILRDRFVILARKVYICNRFFARQELMLPNLLSWRFSAIHLSVARAAFEISWCHRHLGYNPLFKLHRYVPPQRVWFLRRIGLKMGMHFAHAFWCGIGYGFWGNYGSVWTYLSFQFLMYKKEREIIMRIRNIFCWRWI